jgi:hypothetical protein
VIEGQPQQAINAFRSSADYSGLVIEGQPQRSAR